MASCTLLIAWLGIPPIPPCRLLRTGRHDRRTPAGGVQTTCCMRMWDHSSNPWLRLVRQRRRDPNLEAMLLFGHEVGEPRDYVIFPAASRALSLVRVPLLPSFNTSTLCSRQRRNGEHPAWGCQETGFWVMVCQHLGMAIGAPPVWVSSLLTARLVGSASYIPVASVPYMDRHSKPS
ncbi:uncharacterized protein K460DRAFT_170621 [Cucurbitaria berberidis CBS 394.84]|uniref:Uncharacterized protein n=1 Tax=Cucurbitaria berberidis CBS 394.84 TaxID=1168544 RepID=A0A9P4G9H9_9PLEO|nr:uncharacterized protein K460DRAFT_170621 [Cucurbitaria berberidis CBS 394.84]KAF1841633.1 hypothetical protein K460DRAFT_170621 [Cucurbitaria berberidis CBS 394.84]